MADESQRSRHLWLERLIARPEQEIRALIGRYAQVHPYERAEPSDIAESLLSGLQQSDAAVEAFDKGCKNVAEEIRVATGRSVKQSERDVVAANSDDLLSMMIRLCPIRAVHDMHARFVKWNSWAENLIIDQSLDIRRKYYLLLALTQEARFEDDVGAHARRLLPFWLDICAGAGQEGMYDQSYLRVALLGLRRLPLVHVVDANEVAVVEGLLRWAARQKPERAYFDREWRQVAGAFPRAATFWQELLDARTNASRQLRLADPPEILKVWLPHLRTLVNPAASGPASPSALEALAERFSSRPTRMGRRPRRSRPPTQQKVRRAIETDALRTVLPEMWKFIDACRDYMTQTGITELFELSVTRIGHLILKRGIGTSSERATVALALCREVIAVNPRNPFAWSLAVSAFVQLGKYERAIEVGWETVRRFPADLVATNHLATILRRRPDRKYEAECLLREAIGGLPENIRGLVETRCNLAHMLSESGSAVEAEQILRETIERHPMAEKQLIVARNLLARVIEREGRLEEAESLLKETVARYPKAIRARNQLALLLSSKLNSSLEAERVLRQALRELENDRDIDKRDIVVTRNQLSEILAKHLDHADEAKQLLAETIAKYPDNRGAEKQLKTLINDPGAFEQFLDRMAAEFYGEDNTTPAVQTWDDLENKTEINSNTEALDYSDPDGEEFPEIQRSDAGWTDQATHPISRIEPTDEIAFGLGDFHMTAEARRLLTLIRALQAGYSSRDTIEHLQDEVRSIMREDPNEPYLRLVATEAGIERPREDETVFALAFRNAAVKRSIKELEALKARFSNAPQLKLIDEAHMVVSNALSSPEFASSASIKIQTLVNQAASTFRTRLAAA